MAINVSDNIIRGMKTAVDVVGVLNEANRYVMELFDPQFRNIFEIALYPADLFSGLSLGGLGTALLDTIFTRLHLQSITLPFIKVEYESADLVYFAKSVVKPTECTLTLIENEIGLVRNYMERWLDEIMIHDAQYGYRFRDNQLKAKKNAFIIPLMGTSFPSLGGVKMEGLKFSGMGDMTLGHSETDPMIIEVNCTVDKVYWVTATSLLL
jgi:hypothetical protein